MLPTLGSGAGQAIEVRTINPFPHLYIADHSLQDAYVLATLLNRPSTHRADLTRLTEVYYAIRRPFAQHVAALSAEAGRLQMFNHPAIMFPTVNAKGGARSEATAADDPRLRETAKRTEGRPSVRKCGAEDRARP